MGTIQWERAMRRERERERVRVRVKKENELCITTDCMYACVHREKSRVIFQNFHYVPWKQSTFFIGWAYTLSIFSQVSLSLPLMLILSLLRRFLPFLSHSLLANERRFSFSLCFSLPFSVGFFLFASQPKLYLILEFFLNRLISYI